ncbi:adenylate/guanylate cyclase domain-containing protein [Thalassospira tepidiphila]|jgi:adenylate cyclase|uniref:adenylate/guanylate cyclase domain-containing protein n=1 Tax=Thalassospira tepidiphila TaxID=393657 RepID=UPI001BD040A2|nr:adenylate/guanylate cyclase domain-containing protein [Thalassospira tepidiphila]MBS8275263.1 adenylate/guanylate cyclase domain-containing protein [Thalassospira tepidiphila]
MIQNLRLYSGLTMFAYVLTHLLNHAAGIVSPELMETVGEYTTEIWQFPLLEILLLAALVTHFLLATARLTSRRTLRLRKSEWAQMILGLCIPFLLFRHIIATRIIDLGFDVASPFERVLLDLAVFIPFQGILQAITVIVVWAHGCIGIHFWLRVKPFYPKWRNTLGTLSILIPTLALAGYGAAAAEVIRRAEEGGRKYVFGVLDAANVNQAAINFYENAILPFSIISIALALAPFGVRQIRQTIDRVRRGPMLSLPNGRFVRVPPGATALEALRDAGVPMASVCGGHGRCTTCRIHCGSGADQLAEPGQIEAAALKSIQAPKGMRLACQIRPQNDLAVAPLLPPNATARDGRRPGGLSGSERQVVCIFIDLRDSTKLGESKMPYDVLFILNQFFAEMTEALRGTGGYYAQFTGDGLMALYGHESEDTERTILQAFEGAAEMLRRIEGLNLHLKSELPHPLRIGIGIHMGKAIVGEMGPPGRENISAIGDTINTTARLEAETKGHGVPLVISKTLFDHGPIPLPENAVKHEVALRGKDQSVAYYALEAMPDLTQAGK